MLKRFSLMMATTSAILTISFAGCGKSDNNVTSNNADEDALSMATEDSTTNETVMRGGMFGGGFGSLISLTSDQKQQIKSILQNYHPKRPDKEGEATSEEWKTNRMAMRDSLKNAILAVLTPEQKAFIDQIKAQLKAGTIPDTIVKKRVERLTAMLSLTSDQQAQAFNITKQEMQTRLTERLASMKNDSNSVHDSLPGHAKGWNRKGGHFSLSPELINILTDQQKEKLQKMIEERRENFRKHFHGNE